MLAVADVLHDDDRPGDLPRGGEERGRRRGDRARPRGRLPDDLLGADDLALEGAGGRNLALGIGSAVELEEAVAAGVPVDVDPADRLGGGEPLEPLPLAVDPADHPRRVDHPDADREVLEDRRQLPPLGLGDLARLLDRQPAALGLVVQRLLGGDAVLLELLDRLGHRLVQHVVDDRRQVLDRRDVEALELGEVERGPPQGRAQVAHLQDDPVDVVPLLPADPAVLAALDGRVAAAAPEPVVEPVEDRRDVVDELVVGEPFRLGDVAVSLDRFAPDGDQGVGATVEVLRQHGGSVHGAVLNLADFFVGPSGPFRRPMAGGRRGRGARRRSFGARPYQYRRAGSPVSSEPPARAGRIGVAAGSRLPIESSIPARGRGPPPPSTPAAGPPEADPARPERTDRPCPARTADGPCSPSPC